MTDSTTLNQLIGTLATDVVKVGIATGASILAASSIVASSGVLVAFGPLAAVVLVGVGVAMLLEFADEKYGITDKLIAALDEISEKGIDGIIQEKKEMLVNNGKDAVSNIIESVIDYAIERVEHSLKNVIDQLFRKIAFKI